MGTSRSADVRTRGRLITAATAATAAILVLTGCNATAGNSGTAAADRPVDRDATVSVAFTALLRHLNPHEPTSPGIYFQTLHLVYDRLLSLGPDGELKPMLATAWEYSHDGRVLTLTLRDDAKFDDGTPVDAEVVAANIRHAKDKGSAIVSRPLANITTVEVTSPTQVVIKLKTPTTQVLGAFAFDAGMIMHSDLLTGHEAETTTNGSGPYEVVEFIPGAKVVLKRKANVDEYWDADAAQVATFKVTAMPEARSVTSALKSGQIQMGSYSDSHALSDLQAEVDNGQLRVENVLLSSMALNMNRSIEPFDDIAVRKAVNDALDRDSMVDAFFPGSKAMSQWGRDTTDYYLEDLVPGDYDPEQVKADLADAGYPDGVDIGSIEVPASISPTAAEAIQGMLSDAGITSRIQVVDPSLIFANYATGEVGVNLNWTGSMGPSTAELASRLIDETGAARLQPGTTPELDKLIAELDDNRLSDSERATKGQAVNRYLTESYWAAHIAMMNVAYVHDTDLTGLDDGNYDYAGSMGPRDWRYWAMHTG